ncbi:MAG: porin family protein [Bacteroidota bacterium]
MKKLFLILAASFILPNVNGQSTTTTTTTTEPGTTPATEASSTPVQESSSAKHEYKKGYLGVRALATLTSLRVRSIDNSTIATDFIVGYGGGGVIGFNFSKNIGVQAEILYSMLAQKYKDKSEIERNLKISYLNIPLLLVLNTDVSRVVNLNVCVGPQLGINTGSSLNSESSTPENADTVHAVLAVKTADFGFAYGIGVDFMIAPSLKLSIGYRGVQGLIDVSDKSENTTNNDYYILDRAHVNTYSGYAGLAFCF